MSLPEIVPQATNPRQASLYRADDEHDACGVGFVARIDGSPSRAILDFGLQALANLTHRGAVDADGKSQST